MAREGESVQVQVFQQLVIPRASCSMQCTVHAWRAFQGAHRFIYCLSSQQQGQHVTEDPVQRRHQQCTSFPRTMPIPLLPPNRR